MKIKSVHTNIIIVLLIIIMLNIMLPFCVYGGDFDVNDWKPGDPVNYDNVIKKGNIIVGSIYVLGSITSVIALVVLGIKYMVGSIEEKAEYKKTMIPYLIGAILLFAGINIVSIIFEWTRVLNN